MTKEQFEVYKKYAKYNGSVTITYSDLCDLTVKNNKEPRINYTINCGNNNKCKHEKQCDHTYFSCLCFSRQDFC